MRYLKIRDIPWLEFLGCGTLAGLLVAPWGYYIEGDPWPGFAKAFAYVVFLCALYHVPRLYRLRKSRRAAFTALADGASPAGDGGADGR